MKKAVAILSLAVLLLTAGCSSPEIEVVNEASQIEESLSEQTNVAMEEIAPAKISTEIPYEFYLSGYDYDMTDAEEIMEADAQIQGLGADQIVRCGENDFYFFTSGDTEVTIVALPKKDDVYVAFYYDAVLSKVYNSEYTWYFEDGEQSCTVYSYAEDGQIIYSFYDTDGNRLFTRVGDEYYDTQYNILDGEELEKFRKIYGESAEFSDN